MVSAPSDICPSCCFACSSGGLRDDAKYRGPHSLDKFIPAGTLIIRLDPEHPEVECGHTHGEDGWHVVSKMPYYTLLVNGDFCQEMDFLIKHKFICVTYRLGPSLTIFLRIYIIPYDLANVEGIYLNRKNKVMAPARRHLKNLLPTISQNEDHWNGHCSPHFLPKLLPDIKDRRTLAEIYGDLASPRPNLTSGWEDITSRFLDFENDLSGLGLRSSLYNYQRRSVTAMIQRELDLSNVPDPLFIPLSCMKKELFYLQPGTMVILRERPNAATARSGILCEELGTGKTVMILALILATINQISSPKGSIVDDTPVVLTPLSFRHFSSPEAIAARRRFYHGRNSAYPIHGSRVPTLVELLLDRIRISPDLRVPNLTNPRETKQDQRRKMIAAEVERIRPGELLHANTPFYLDYNGVRFVSERVQSRTAGAGPRVIYLTSATLIVVPANLVSQWDREIQKHCQYPIRVLVLRTGTRMPHISSLASDYDIVLMTYQRYTSENKHNKKGKLHSWNICSCPEFFETRIPDCKCKVPGVSPLLQIRWKRLVIDEGHVSASLFSTLNSFTDSLSVERRWIVTGTPTTNLLGLSFGKKNQSLVDHSDFSDAEDVGQDDDASTPRLWTSYDRGDLQKLNKMITHFIAVPQFHAGPNPFENHIIEPLMDKQGPRLGAIQVLAQVMEMTMIRHRIEDVEDDVVLPPLKHESVLLDLDPYAVKSYNALQATIVINAVDSQRTDQDYLFHPRSVKYLQTTMENMSQLMFWSTDADLYNVDELLRTAHEYVQRAVERGMSLEDIALLDEAFKHIKLAAEDRLWIAMHRHEDVPYRVRGLQQAIFNSWTRTPHEENTHDRSQTGFLHADRLLKMQDLIIQRPCISQETFMKEGASVAAYDLHQRQLHLDSQKKRHRKSTRKHHEEANTSLLAGDAAKKARDPTTLKEMQKDLEAAIAREIETENVDTTPPSPTTRTSKYHGGSLLSTSLLGKVRLGCTASSKLNYIINEVLQYSDAEKFLIFSDSALTLAHVSEALELMHVKFLRFTTEIKPRIREQLVLTFETSETYRVLLMELRYGARGLNLVSASRVIFCEPVWQADVESQAIKRVHRIGQVKPITVKTLAIRGTAEETMVARRDALKSSQTKLPKLIEETGMRQFIADPKFISYAPERYSTVDLPLLRIETTGLGDSQTVSTPRVSPQKRIRSHEPLSIDATPEPEPPTKRKRVVRFE